MHKGRLALMGSYSQLLGTIAPASVGRFLMQDGRNARLFADELKRTLGDGVTDIQLGQEGYCSASFPVTEGNLSDVFDVLLSRKEELGLHSFTLGSLSLQDLFCIATTELDQQYNQDHSLEPATIDV
ncbi:hypothetical protein KIPB_008932 [Kipferlia bialata]|uniref:Uncharacterized protein n=1 Tax=Kipferlia bialata TaxID=797122 RepID=A0A9K3GLR1_9EUKA|nr:hypothetical protein KIPB_008932 [Kipferlia bialata]|eukprot:g8932.t1